MKLLNKFCEHQDSILQSSNYDSDVLPNQLTSQPVGEQSFLTSFNAIYSELRLPIPTPFSRRFNHPICKKPVTITTWGLWISVSK